MNMNDSKLLSSFDMDECSDFDSETTDNLPFYSGQGQEQAIRRAVLSNVISSEYKDRAERTGREHAARQQMLRLQYLLDSKREKAWKRQICEVVEKLEQSRRSMSMHKAKYEATKAIVNFAERDLVKLYREKPASNIKDSISIGGNTLHGMDEKVNAVLQPLLNKTHTKPKSYTKRTQKMGIPPFGERSSPRTRSDVHFMNRFCSY